MGGERVHFICLLYPPCPVMPVIMKMEQIVTFSFYHYLPLELSALYGTTTL